MMNRTMNVFDKILASRNCGKVRCCCRFQEGDRTGRAPWSCGQVRGVPPGRREPGEGSHRTAYDGRPGILRYLDVSAGCRAAGRPIPAAFLDEDLEILHQRYVLRRTLPGASGSASGALCLAALSGSHNNPPGYAGGFLVEAVVEGGLDAGAVDEGPVVREVGHGAGEGPGLLRALAALGRLVQVEKAERGPGVATLCGPSRGSGRACRSGRARPSGPADAAGAVRPSADAHEARRRSCVTQLALIVRTRRLHHGGESIIAKKVQPCPQRTSSL